jgi:hypothetical protein
MNACRADVCLSVDPFFRIIQLDNHWTDLDEIRYERYTLSVIIYTLYRVRYTLKTYLLMSKFGNTNIADEQTFEVDISAAYSSAMKRHMVTRSKSTQPWSRNSLYYVKQHDGYLKQRSILINQDSIPCAHAPETVTLSQCWRTCFVVANLWYVRRKLRY